MIDYEDVSRDRRRFLALTGLTLIEFQFLLPAFSAAYARDLKTRRKQPRVRRPGGGRRGQLASPEQKLLFILTYQKTYPLQVVMGELFGMSQSAANQWIHRLLPIVREALKTLKVTPERTGRQFARTAQAHDRSAQYIIDGVERPRQRPKDPVKQALFYSGKKKRHTHKNLVIVHTRSRRISYLSSTQTGKTHDKKLADQEHVVYPRQTVLYQDTGFQGYQPDVRQTRQPKKAARQRTWHKGQATQPQLVACTRSSGTRNRWSQTIALCERCFTQHAV